MGVFTCLQKETFSKGVSNPIATITSVELLLSWSHHFMSLFYVLQNQNGHNDQDGSACRLNISGRSQCQAPKKSSKALFLVMLQAVVDNSINPFMDLKKQKG
jgi:hypothetical protein